jgi:hypothetical protein
MAITTLARRQFNTTPTEEWPGNAVVAGTYAVTGSTSVLVINNTRTNLANDDLFGNSYGWFPSPDLNSYGIIAQGNDTTVANTQADGSGVAYVSFWGWDTQETQVANDTAFRQLAGNILGATYANTASAKSALRIAGYYYQYPVGYDGQSPNTGPGSDT